MAIRVTCSCGRELNVKDELAGKKGKCPQCGRVIQVPTLEEIAVQTEAERAAPEPAPQESAAGVEETPTKRCVHCRKSIPEDAVFCIHCGTDLRTGRKHEGGEAEETERYDFFKVAPDVIMRPMEAIGAIVEAPPSVESFKKALIFFGIGLVIFTWIVPYNNENAIQLGLKGADLSVWSFVLAFLIGIVCVITDALIANVGGTMFGTSGVGFAQVFMAILAARALVGMAMVVPGIYFLASQKNAMPIVMGWVPRVIRLVWGTFLMYCVMYRSFDCGTVPAIVFAMAATIARALLFWLPQFFGVHLI